MDRTKSFGMLMSSQREHEIDLNVGRVWMHWEDTFILVILQIERVY